MNDQPETHTAEMPPVAVAAEDVAVGGMPPADAAPEPPAAEPAPEPVVETSPAEEATPKRMHNYSEYLHVGAGAEDCEHGADGACEDPQHSHIWVRLPNQFERANISEKAAAAAARRLRLLRDPESDQRVILDGELEQLQVANDRPALIEQIVGKDFLEDHLAALKEVLEEDEDEWATIDEDRERLRVLEPMPEEERPKEEFEELSAHLKEHTRLVNERRDAIQKPKRDELEAKGTEDLVDILREQQIEAIGTAARREESAKWEWYICSFKPKSPDKPGFPSDRFFSSIDTFTSASTEEIEAISEAVTRLETEASEKLKG